MVIIDGLNREELMKQLQQSSIHLNAYAEMLLADERFMISSTRYSLHTVELTARNLGFPDGATTEQMFTKAQQLGLKLCPLELAPYLRMQYIDQPEDMEGEVRHNQAPSGSVTVASEPISEEDTFPKGFYLRHMHGELWLRGYCADDLHSWNANDRFIFVK
ncbi:helicase [Paenibacillus wenxiniae]|uniref:Helicase n=1 Tax=Paenibacillus wenxiniae TaxID=1636843 RepID=A0ABW4RGU1_9BACL